ncbi:hypothetical protein [Massilia sp. CCM 8734]|uniref:hypothetical protein n=1 Tax=Massilia sp. CCM 8734 TaxID=2609283 RepID=UPI001420D4FD|nr:hypothetical protein [Massilia sp. CCM 8734]NIA00704.1 hypothetical protein [Massilia sp. CCM 8734]
MTMTMTAYRFRLLLCLHFILETALAVAVAYTPNLISPQLQAALDAEPVHWSMGNVALNLSLSLFLGVCSMAGLIGMFMFKSWGRTLSLVTTVAFMTVMFVPGAAVMSWLDYVLAELLSMLWGAILALAYFSPISSLFSSTRSPA